MEVKIMYRSHFKGWIQITEAQKESISKHIRRHATALKTEEIEDYISKQFKYI